MTENERILVNSIAGSYLPGEAMAIYGSIQNYRRLRKKEGMALTFAEAAAEWKERIFLPIISEIRSDMALSIAAGSRIEEAFFPALYAVEDNGFEFSAAAVRRAVMKKAHGIRAFISRLIA